MISQSLGQGGVDGAVGDAGAGPLVESRAAEEDVLRVIEGAGFAGSVQDEGASVFLRDGRVGVGSERRQSGPGRSQEQQQRHQRRL